MNGQMLGQSEVLLSILLSFVKEKKTYKILVLLFFLSRLCVVEALAARAFPVSVHKVYESLQGALQELGLTEADLPWAWPA